MTRRWIAMQIQAPGGFQDPVQLRQARRHHAQVGHHVVLAQEGPQGPEQLRQPRAVTPHHVVVGRRRLLPPLPGVLEGGDLGRGLLPALFGEEDVVGGVGVEGRVQVNQVNRAHRDVVAPENLQVVPEKKLILPGFHLRLFRFFNYRSKLPL